MCVCPARSEFEDPLYILGFIPTSLPQILIMTFVARLNILLAGKLAAPQLAGFVPPLQTFCFPFHKYPQVLSPLPP